MGPLDQITPRLTHHVLSTGLTHTQLQDGQTNINFTHFLTAGSKTHTQVVKKLIWSDLIEYCVSNVSVKIWSIFLNFKEAQHSVNVPFQFPRTVYVRQVGSVIFKNTELQSADKNQIKKYFSYYLSDKTVWHVPDRKKNLFPDMCFWFQLKNKEMQNAFPRIL